MNSWKFNSTAQNFLKILICKIHKIAYSDFYRWVKTLDNENGIVTTADGKKYKVTLEEIV